MTLVLPEESAKERAEEKEKRKEGGKEEWFPWISQREERGPSFLLLHFQPPTLDMLSPGHMLTCDWSTQCEPIRCKEHTQVERGGEKDEGEREEEEEEMRKRQHVFFVTWTDRKENSLRWGTISCRYGLLVWPPLFCRWAYWLHTSEFVFRCMNLCIVSISAADASSWFCFEYCSISLQQQ